MPFGVEAPFVGCSMVDEEGVWLTIDGNGAGAHTVQQARNRVKQVDAGDKKRLEDCPGADALIQPHRTGGPFLGAGGVWS